jgi:hypothetical protein
MEYVPPSYWLWLIFHIIPPSHDADAFFTSLRDNTTGNAKAIGPQDTIEAMSIRNDQTFPMLLRFLKETKKESYFTGLQDNNPAAHRSCGSKM